MNEETATFHKTIKLSRSFKDLNENTLASTEEQIFNQQIIKNGLQTKTIR